MENLIFLEKRGIAGKFIYLEQAEGPGVARGKTNLKKNFY